MKGIVLAERLNKYRPAASEQTKDTKSGEGGDNKTTKVLIDLKID